jgi:putative spermidine/putrescine transport system ATP-binding protein
MTHDSPPPLAGGGRGRGRTELPPLGEASEGAGICLDAVTKRFGDTVVVRELTLALESGELVALLGPSGCGKTTTLRMIAGFEYPTRGSIYLTGQDVTAAAPEHRNCGMVFQNYALFPHLTVEQNVAFGLEMRRTPRAEIRRRVGEILERMGLGALKHRYPRQISGGQQQRTALARALVTNPGALLLDEPLANLDAALREEMRFYIRSLQREFHITTLYVTHDQSEALVLADRIAVLMNGELQQFGTPLDVYYRPQTAAVASFTGLTNLLPGRIESRSGDQYLLATRAGPLLARGLPGLAAGAEVMLSLRPEHFQLGSAMADGDGCNRLSGVVRERTFAGSFVDYRVAVGDVLLRVQATTSASCRPGEAICVTITPASAWVVPRDPV